MIQLNERGIKTINPDKYNIVVISIETQYRMLRALVKVEQRWKTKIRTQNFDAIERATARTQFQWKGKTLTLKFKQNWYTTSTAGFLSKNFNSGWNGSIYCNQHLLTVLYAAMIISNFWKNIETCSIHDLAYREKFSEKMSLFAMYCMKKIIPDAFGIVNIEK